MSEELKTGKEWLKESGDNDLRLEGGLNDVLMSFSHFKSLFETKTAEKVRPLIFDPEHYPEDREPIPEKKPKTPKPRKKKVDKTKDSK